MKRIKKVENIRNLFVSEFKLPPRDDIYFQDGTIFFDKKIAMIYTHPKFILIFGEDSSVTIYEKDTCTTYTARRRGPFISEEMVLLKKLNNEYYIESTYAWNFKIQEKVWEFKGFFYETYIVDGFLFGVLQNDLCRFNTDTGEILWRFDLGQFYMDVQQDPGRSNKIKKSIGIFNGVFFIKVGVSIILGVDVLSGKEVFRYEYKPGPWDFRNLELDKNTGTIFNLGYYHYFEFNIPSGQIDFVSLEEQSKKLQVETNSMGAWHGDRIYFWELSGNNRFGVFERSTRSIIDVGIIEEAAKMDPAIIDLKYADHKIYVLDRMKTLHIFEE